MFSWLRKPKLLDHDYVGQYLAAFIVSVGLLVEGLHYGWSSSAIPKLLDSSLNITEDEATYITHMFTYGSLAYNILSFADYPRMNQKVGVISSVLIMTISWIMIAVSQSATLLMIARFFAGAGRGLVYQVSVNYICEIASPEIRGFLGSLVLVMTNLGCLLIYCFGPYLNIFYTSLICAIISLSELIVVKYVPESPYTLLLRGKTRQARSVLRSLRNLWNVEAELEHILDTVKKQDEENSSILSIFTVPSNRKALFITTVLTALQGMVGINIPIRQILKLSGGDIESYRLAVVTSLISVASCALTAFFIDYVGRKTILIISFSACGVSLLILGFYTFFFSSLHLSSLHILPIACLLSHSMTYRMGVGLVPLLLSGELFPVNVKNVATSLAALLSAGIHGATIWALEGAELAVGPHAVYWVCAGNCALGLLFTVCCVPETSGKTLWQIQVQLKGGSAQEQQQPKVYDRNVYRPSF